MRRVPLNIEQCDIDASLAAYHQMRPRRCSGPIAQRLKRAGVRANVYDDHIAADDLFVSLDDDALAFVRSADTNLEHPTVGPQVVHILVPEAT